MKGLEIFIILFGGIVSFGFIEGDLKLNKQNQIEEVISKDATYGYYKTYADYKSGNSIKVKNIGGEKHSLRSGKAHTYKITDENGTKEYSGLSIWGFEINGCTFRTQGIPSYSGRGHEKGLALKIVEIGANYVYYENGNFWRKHCAEGNTNSEKLDNKFYLHYANSTGNGYYNDPNGGAVNGSCCYVSKDLESPIYALTPYSVAIPLKKSTMLRLGLEVEDEDFENEDLINHLKKISTKEGKRFTYTKTPRVEEIRKCGKKFVN